MRTDLVPRGDVPVHRGPCSKTLTALNGGHSLGRALIDFVLSSAVVANYLGPYTPSDRVDEVVLPRLVAALASVLDVLESSLVGDMGLLNTSREHPHRRLYRGRLTHAM